MKITAWNVIAWIGIAIAGITFALFIWLCWWLSGPH